MNAPRGPSFAEYLPCPPVASPYEGRPEVVGINDVNVHLEDGTQLLHDVNLSIHQGEFALIKGPSGSGKSTIHRTIARIQEPSTGEVRLFGESLHDAEPAALDGLRRFVGLDSRSIKKRRVARMFQCRVGLLVQNPALKGGWTVFENMVYYSEITGMADATTNDRALEILQEFGLEQKANKDAATLSGGEQQKAALGGLLLWRPDLLLLDEPTASMDVPLKHMVLGKLRDLTQNEGTTVVMVSHDDQAAEYASRIIQVESGRAVSDTRRRPRQNQ